MTTENSYPGIDYSRGTANFDKETGIHFGIIGMNAEGLSEWAWESMEADYGDPTCPKCGNEVKDYDEAVKEIEANPQKDGLSEEQLENSDEYSCADYVCLTCGIILGSDEVLGDEPVGHTLDKGGYKGFVDSNNDLMILKSPYYTHAQFCSPCAPGAGHLENPCPTGPKTYCLGHDWFEGGKAPYPVYDVATGKLVTPRDKCHRTDRLHRLEPGEDVAGK